jgi:hypothetical protein
MKKLMFMSIVGFCIVGCKKSHGTLKSSNEVTQNEDSIAMETSFKTTHLELSADDIDDSGQFDSAYVIAPDDGGLHGIGSVLNPRIMENFQTLFTRKKKIADNESMTPSEEPPTVVLRTDTISEGLLNKKAQEDGPQLSLQDKDSEKDTAAEEDGIVRIPVKFENQASEIAVDMHIHAPEVPLGRRIDDYTFQIDKQLDAISTKPRSEKTDADVKKEKELKILRTGLEDLSTEVDNASRLNLADIVLVSKIKPLFPKLKELGFYKNADNKAIIDKAVASMEAIGKKDKVGASKEDIYLMDILRSELNLSNLSKDEKKELDRFIRKSLNPIVENRLSGIEETFQIMLQENTSKVFENTARQSHDVIPYGTPTLKYNPEVEERRLRVVEKEPIAAVDVNEVLANHTFIKPETVDIITIRSIPLREDTTVKFKSTEESKVKSKAIAIQQERFNFDYKPVHRKGGEQKKLMKKMRVAAKKNANAIDEIRSQVKKVMVKDAEGNDKEELFLETEEIEKFINLFSQDIQDTLRAEFARKSKKQPWEWQDFIFGSPYW